MYDQFSRNPIDYDELPTIRLVATPWRARQVALTVTLTFLAGVALLTLAPWLQNVPGQGRVTAYAPLERQQSVEAPIKGRITRWWVQEGSRVKAGDPLVEISDNDPRYFERLEAERATVQTQLEGYQRQVAVLSERVRAAEESRDHTITSLQAKQRATERKLNQSRQKLRAAEAKHETQLLNLARERVLVEQGLTSKRKVEFATMYEAEARTNRAAAQQQVEASREMVNAAVADLSKNTAEANAKVEKARADLAKAEVAVAQAQAKLVSMDTKIARQLNQRVVAPRDGTVLKLLVAEGGEQVKPGDKLLMFVPDGLDRAVELWVDGNDAALISEGRQVRLQFEGWPAVQFTGWPSVAVGTFGGVVAFVDAADDGKGNFRILVRPDPDDEPWPNPYYLRQGALANGWIMLDEVSLGFEVWRQLNGFPPVIDPPGDSKDGKGKNGKGKNPVKMGSK
ncbi:MAG: transporter [Myxococcales bacterium]|nr:transporter [Myxococcales bacterium]